MEYGSYSGNGTSPRQITVGFKPKFLLVYAVGQPLIYYDWNYRTADLYSGVATENGASMGITLSDTGFSVENVEDSVIGVGPILNQTGKTYAWMALRCHPSRAMCIRDSAGGKGFDTGPGDSLPGKKAFRVLLQQPGFRSFFAAYSNCLLYTSRCV